VTPVWILGAPLVDRQRQSVRTCLHAQGGTARPDQMTRSPIDPIGPDQLPSTPVLARGLD